MDGMTDKDLIHMALFWLLGANGVMLLASWIVRMP